MKRIVLTALLSATACATAPAKPPPPAPAAAVTSFQSVTIGIGDTAVLGPLRVRPIAVIEDSRCPADVQCIWAGRLRILVEIDRRNRSETLHRELLLGDPVQFTEGLLSLSGAHPTPVAGRTVEPLSYRFTLSLQSAARP